MIRTVPCVFCLGCQNSFAERFLILKIIRKIIKKTSDFKLYKLLKLEPLDMSPAIVAFLQFRIHLKISTVVI